MKINKKWIILIYVLILINVALVMALVVLNSTNVLLTDWKYQTIDRELHQKIISDWNKYINYQLSLNQDWIWYADDVRCPNSITMSWNTMMTSWITSQLTYSGSTFFCSWSYNSSPFNLFFNSEYNAFLAASYNNLTIWLVTNWSNIEWSSKFLDDDQTFMSFAITSYAWTDSYDDNFNSDDYRSSSTWSIEYPWWYLDNDDLWRKVKYGYITSKDTYENIFWNNFETNAYIEANPNNTWSLNQNISITESWSVFLEVDKNFSLKLVMFDRSRYTKFIRELVQTWTYLSSWTIQAWSGYIQILWWALSLTWWIDINTTFFNFKDNDYAIFLSNATNSTLYYRLSAKNPLLKDVYINPINDSFSDQIKYMWNSIITSSWNIYIWKQFEVLWLKTLATVSNPLNYCASNPICSPTWCTLTTWTPTSPNQSWVKDETNCGFTCNANYSWANCETYTPPAFSCWDTVSAWWYTYTTLLWPDWKCWTSTNMKHWTMLVNESTIPSDINTLEKWCYNNDVNICNTDWALYTWAEAMWFPESCNSSICAQSEDTSKSVCWALWSWWNLPTDAQWYNLENLSKNIWEACSSSRSSWECLGAWWTWNKLSWLVSVLPWTRDNGDFYVGLWTDWWRWSTLENTDINSWTRYLISSNDTIRRYYRNKERWFSIVCIKN